MEFLNSLSWTILSFIFVLGIMIFIHELGHYLMAKWLGIRVEVFSLGFGPRLVGFRRGDTDYRISLLPLGGFVKMRGENYGEDLSGSEEEFLSRPKKHRFLVAAAGPAMNLALAVILLTANFMVGVQVPGFLSEPAVVGYIVPDSPAQEAGIEVGDRIAAVGPQSTPTWEDLQLAVATSPGQTLPIQLVRENRQIQKIVAIEEDERTGTGFIGVLTPVSNLISAVEDGPAKESGLQPGDFILSASKGETTVHDLPGILELIASSENQAISFRIERAGEFFERSIAPVEMDGRARLGVAIGQVPRYETRLERYGLFEAARRSLERNYQLTALTFQIVGKLLTGQTSLKMMSGPIEIAKFSGQAASQGLQALLGFMAVISLQLGIFNLFPIPILDGGVIMLLLIEGVIGRELSLRVKERIFQAGFIFLILLMSIVIFNDIAKNV